ncbi:MAG: TolC family protein [Bdellovibrionales bacterium]
MRANILNDRRSVQLAEQNFRLSQNKFKTGKVSVTDLNNNEALLTQAKLSYAIHQFQLAESLAMINRLVELHAGERQ